MSDTAGAFLLAGRLTLAFFFAMAGWRHITGGKEFVGFARSVGFPAPALAPWPTGVWLGLGAISLGLGIWPDIGALMIVVFLTPAAVWFHAYWKAPEDQTLMQTQLLYRNVTLVGACVALFGVFTGLGDALRFSITSALIDLR
ncbi:MAG: DoxX family protein [Acidimicrobiales bacterium]